MSNQSPFSSICHTFSFLSELPALDNRFPRNKTVREGNPFTLQCRPLGNTGKFNVTWITNSGSNTSFPVSVNLTINATRFDAGEYHCIVTNGVESVKSPAVYVAVLCKYVSTAVIGHFPVPLNLIMKARLSGKFLL